MKIKNRSVHSGMGWLVAGMVCDLLTGSGAPCLILAGWPLAG